MSRKTQKIHAVAKAAAPIIGQASEVVFAAAGDTPDGPKSFSVQVYNGGALQVSRWDYPVVIDLAGMKARKNVIANLDHDSGKRVGHVTAVENDGSKVTLNGVASAASAHRDEVINSAAGGFPWEASIEAAPTKEPDFVSSGEKVVVNGQTFTGPVYVARKSELYGFAFLSRGADAGTKVKIAAEAASSTEGSNMKPELKLWIEAQGFDVETINAKQKESLTAAFEAIEAGKKKAATAVDTNDGWDLEEIKAAGRDNVEEVDAILAQYEDSVPDKTAYRTIRAEARTSVAALKSKAIGERWSLSHYQLQSVKAQAVIEKKLVQAERPQGPSIHGSSNDVDGLVIEAAMAQHLKLPDIEKHYGEKVLEAAHKQFKGRIGLQQIIIMAAAQRGMSFGIGQRLDNSTLRQALRIALTDDVHAAASTLSLPGLMSNVANKELLLGYESEDDAWREIADVKTVTDFKTVTSYRMLDNMKYEQLAADGRIKHGTVGEESYTRSASTYAKLFSLTRQDIINDDLGAFNDLRTRLGRGAKEKFNEVFWTAFLNNSSFFTSGRGNYITGATSTLLTDMVGLQLALTAFDALRTPTADGSKKIGNRTGGSPSMLLVPPELHTAADVIFKNSNLGSGTTNSNANIYAGKYRPVKVTQLSDSNFTGYSSTAWYLLRPKEVLAPMVVSFLNGVESPTVESAEASFDQLGIDFRGYHDFGADQAEYLCGVKSKGAA
jgi:phage major head subunit gpT-like protein